MTQPITATYTGPVEQLKGCSALVRSSDKENTVEVQFTDVNARKPDECAGKRDVTDLEKLMFGWHEMPKDHFKKASKAKTAPKPEEDDG